MLIDQEKPRQPCVTFSKTSTNLMTKNDNLKNTFDSNASKASKAYTAAKTK